MRIDGAGPDSTRPAGSRSVDKASHDKTKGQKSEASSRASADRIEISDAGRAAAAKLSGSGTADGETLSVERVEQIRGRIDAGLYDSPEVQQEVARRILDTGDLGTADPASGEA